MPRTTQITIPGRLPGLNEYTAACRSKSWYKGSKMKQDAEEVIKNCLFGAISLKKQVHIEFKWYEPNSKRDKDNIAFAKKFILDALVSRQIIPGDGWKHIEGFTDSFYIDADNPRIEVIITEVSE